MDFQAYQKQFVAHLRDPDKHSAPQGIEDRRIKIYADLLFNNVESFVSAAFPVMRSLFSENDWLSMIQRFFKTHQCESPYFVEISQEFLAFFSQTESKRWADMPFLLELAHYEWVELDVSVQRLHLQQEMLNDDEMTTEVLNLFEAVRVVSYQYPVHQISSDTQFIEPEQPTYLVVYRDFEDDVSFLQINALTAMVCELVRTHQNITFSQLLARIIEQLPQMEPDAIEAGLVQMLQLLAAKGILRKGS